MKINQTVKGKPKKLSKIAPGEVFGIQNSYGYTFMMKLDVTHEEESEYSAVNLNTGVLIKTDYLKSAVLLVPKEAALSINTSNLP